MIGPGAIVIVHLVNPTEKFFGVLQDLNVAGVTFRGINLNSFDDWMAQAVHPESQTLGLSTVFVPLFRHRHDRHQHPWLGAREQMDTEAGNGEE